MATCIQLVGRVCLITIVSLLICMYIAYKAEWHIHSSISSFTSKFRNITNYAGILRQYNGEMQNISNLTNEHKSVFGSKQYCIAISRYKFNGLGNGMFRYAALFTLTNLTGRTPVLGPWFKDVHSAFNITIPNNTAKKKFNNFTVIKQTSCASMINDIRAIQKDIMLDGYFIGYCYFEAMKQAIRREFTFRSGILRSVDMFFKGLSPSKTRVGIHVRGTDHNTTSRRELGQGTPPASYFHNAMNVFRTLYKDVQFVVCSDNIKWAQSQLTGNDTVFSKSKSASADMAILSSCDHVIVGRGTFGFWVGWLCPGTAVYYEDPVRSGNSSQRRFPLDEFNTWFGVRQKY